MSKNRTWLSHGMLYEFKGWLAGNEWMEIGEACR